jgi:hypothetical protein
LALEYGASLLEEITEEAIAAHIAEMDAAAALADPPGDAPLVVRPLCPNCAAIMRRPIEGWQTSQWVCPGCGLVARPADPATLAEPPEGEGT